MISKTTIYRCHKCQSQALKKNGKTPYGKQKYACKDCGAYGTLILSPPKYSKERKEEIIQAYYERGSMRGIQRIFGVPPTTLIAWLKKNS